MFNIFTHENGFEQFADRILSEFEQSPWLFKSVVAQKDLSYETDKNGDIVVTILAPGHNKSTVKISVDDASRKVSIKSGAESSKQAPGIEQAFTVAKGFNLEKLEAQMTDGVLRLRFPKESAPKPEKKVRQVDIA